MQISGKNVKENIKEYLQRKELNMASSNAYYEFSFSCLKPEEILSFLELDLSNEEENHFYEDYFLNNIKELDIKDYQADLYRNRLGHIDIKKGSYAIKNLIIKPYQTFPYDDIKVNDNKEYLELSSIGYFTKEYSYPALMKDNTVWMSVDPSEINTMAPYIKEVEGHLFVLGLGMGYFPYLASKNKKVKDITIVELDENIIDIFNAYLLPKLDFSCPIHIIHDDAFNYIKHHDMSKYDTLFMDIWHNPEDGLPLFIKLENLLLDYQGKKYYWLHKSLIAMLRRCLLTVIEEQISGATEKDYLKENNDYDHIINQLYFLTKEEIIDNPSKIKEILSDEYLSKLAKKVR